MKLRYLLPVFFTTLLNLPPEMLLAQSYLMQDSLQVEDCDGFFLDSGGGNAPYGPNENFTATFCSDDTDGTHVQLVFSGVELGAGDNLCFFDGPDTGATQLSCADDFDPGEPFIIQATAANTSGCVTITFTSNDTEEGQGWSADINCVPACQIIQAELVSTDPAVMPVDTGWIDVCPGERVFFTGQGVYPQNGIIYDHSDFTSDFSWDFGDGTQAVGPNVTNVYDEPGGYVVQMTITDQFGCTNTNFINQRVRVSTQPEFNIGGTLDPEICVNDTVRLNAMVNQIDSNINVSVVPTEGSFQTAGVRSDSLPLPDGTGASFSTSIGFTDFSPGQVLTNISDLVNICVNMEHSWLHDLEISLTCPSGESVILHNYIPTDTEGAGQTFLGVPNDPDNPSAPETVQTPWGPIQPGVGWDYCWTPDATNGTWREYASQVDPPTLPPGNYNAFDDLEDLLGCPLNGEWTITVIDLWGIDNGFIFSWGIEFASDLYPSLETFTPNLVDYAWENEPSIYFQEQDSIAASPQNAGTASYTFWVTDDFGCSYDTTVNITVLPETHPECYNCSDNLGLVNDTIICEGESVTMDVSTDQELETEVLFQANPLYTIGFQNHPPNNPYESTIAVNSINPATLTSPADQIVSVCIDMETDWNADLRFFLRAPDGSLLELSTGNGGSSDNYTNTCFTPVATTPITAGTGPFTGNFQPEGNWNDLNGAPINGNWTLLVSDAFGPTVFGQLNSWSITFTATNEITYNWTPAASLSCDDCPAPVATPALSTAYIVTSSDSYNCVYSDTINVGVINQLAEPQVSCEISGSGQLTFSWIPIDGIVQYEINIDGSGWQGPVTGASYVVDNLTDQQTVTFSVRPYVPDPTINCTVPVGTSICLYEDCLLSGQLDGPPTAVSCNGQTDGAVSVSAAGGEVPYEFFLDGSGSAQATGDFSGLAGGDHFVVILDATFCRDTVFFSVDEPEPLTISLIETQSISCNGDDNGALQASVEGGNGGNTFTWSHSDGLTGDQATGLITGGYAVTVTDANGCTAETDYLLEEPASLSLSLDATDPNCFNSSDGTATATASGGTGTITYEWSNGNIQAQANNLAAGQYCVTVTDENGCQLSDCIDLTAPTAIIIESVTYQEPDCFGNATGAATVVATGGAGGFTYLWDDPLAQINPTAVDLPAGNYEVMITDANGCQETAQVTVTQPALLTVTANASDASCNGGSDGSAFATAQGGAGGYSFEWSGGQDGQEASGLDAGAYTVTVTDANGCMATTQTTVGQPAEPLSVELTQTLRSCYGEADNEVQAAATGGTPGYTYQWSNGQSGALAVDLDTIAYTVTVTDDKGCTTEAEFIPEDWGPFSINLTLNQPSCNGFTDGALAVTIVEGGAGEELTDYTYSWSNGMTGTLLQDVPGGVDYSVTVTDSQGCSGDTTRFMNQPDPITFELTSTSTLCNGSADGAASITNLDGEFDVFTFEWENGQTDTTATGLTAGAYTVTVYDAVGCSEVGSVTVSEPDPLTLEWAVEDNDCFGGNDGALEANAGGGTPAYSFAWSNGRTGDRIEGLAAGDYGLTVTDANGCQTTTTTSVEQPDSLVADITTQDVRCAGDRDGRIRILTDGGTPPYLYSLDNQEFSGISTLIGLSAGDYTVRIRDARGCIYTNAVTINEPLPFEVDAGDPRYTINYGDSLILNGIAINNAGPVEFVWSGSYPGTLSCTECPATISYTENQITYELYGIDSLGCEATDLVTVFVEKDRMVAVPTGFTPNGDNQNDRLLVHGQEGTRVTLFQIYDRWGELLYENGDFPVNDPAGGWDGAFRGEPVGGGVYIWYVEVEYVDGVVEAFKGQTTVIR